VAQKRPTEEDRVEAIRCLLEGVAGAIDAVDLAASVAHLHPNNNTFPGEIFMGLAADALELAGIDRGSPIQLEDLCSRFLPEVEFKGKQNQRMSYAIFTSAALQAGLEPDLLEEVIWWPDEYWRYALYAAVALMRASAEHQGIPVESLARQLADQHHIDRSP
jgi:hypothetical protein